MASAVRLSRLLRRREVAEVVDLVGGGGAAVFDVDGRQLAGPPARPGDDPRVRVSGPDGSLLGTVAGPGADAVGRALGALAAQEQERRRLADEVLAMYREVNLLYALGEVLATATTRADLAGRALREATRLVDVETGEVVVDVHGPTVEARVGGGGETGIPSDLTRLRIEPDGAGSLLVAPLTFRDTQRGALVLRRRSGPFDASDLKLIGSVAVQCAGVLERILDEESRAAAAAEREGRLRRQVEQLRIELDHHRQAEQVGQITETDYFGGLRAQASALRRIIADGEPPEG